MMRDCGTLLVLCMLLMGLWGCATSSPRVDDLLLIRQEAFLAYRQGDYPRAIARFEDLVAAMPKDAELWFRLGNAYARNRQPQQAIAAYENALLRNPRLQKAWYNKGMIHLKEALKTFDEMAQYVPPTDPVGQKGLEVRDQLIDLLRHQGAPAGKGGKR